MPSIAPLLGDTGRFFDALADGMARHGLPLSLGPMDHICYRAADNREYLALRERLQAHGDGLVEGMIGGRPIITFRLGAPLASPFGPIDCLELAAPKPGKRHHPGLEHGEIVVPDLHRLQATHPRVPFDDRALAQSLPELGLSLPPYQIKFHPRSLADTIAEEIALGLVIPVPAGYFRTP